MYIRQLELTFKRLLVLANIVREMRRTPIASSWRAEASTYLLYPVPHMVHV